MMHTFPYNIEKMYSRLAVDSYTENLTQKVEI